MERENADASKLVLWLDWFSIDQLDESKKKLGVSSMISYTAKAKYMLIPCRTEQVVNGDFGPGVDPDECAAYYPEDVADYGDRGCACMPLETSRNRPLI